ncbi:MAG: thiolase family protein, partial [Pseudomonadota bacterium]
VEGVIAGSVQHDTKAPNIARIASIKAGFPEALTDYSIQCNCNTGFIGLLTAIGRIAMGDGDLYLAGGVESMSNFGYRLKEKTSKYGSLSEIQGKLNENPKEFSQDFDIIDCLPEGLTDSENDLQMIGVAEIMANLYQITREEQEKYTLKNLQRAVEAIEGGKLKKYIVPLGEFENDSYPLNRKRMLKKPESFAKAAHIFGDDQALNAEKLFLKNKKQMDRLGIKKLTPTVTMYTACIPGDGAGAAIVTTEERAKALGLTPLLRVINWNSAGVNPVIMGIGPMESTSRLFANPKTERAKNVKFKDIDMIEIHEAFAAQVLSVFKESESKNGFKWSENLVNVYGGSLAFTHPLAATNFRLITNILSRFDEVPSLKYALATGCAGGGLGTTVVFERY